MLILLAACAEPPDTDTGKPTTEGFALQADAHVPVPFATVGETPDAAELTLTSVGRAADGPVTVTIDGDFAVDGETSPLGADDTRRYTVRYIGDTSAPVIATGSVTFTEDGATATTTLAAVIGDPELGSAPWTGTAWGDQTLVDLPSAPFPDAGAPYDDATVLIFLPDGFSDRDGVGVVTHLHGWYATVDQISRDQRLTEQLALSGRDAVLVVPQGPVDAADGDFGKLEAPGGHAALLRDVLSVLYRDGYVENPVLGALALTAHSGGYGAAAAILDNGDLPIQAVHLFDALYGERASFLDFAASGGVLRTTWTASGGTDGENASLADDLDAAGLSYGTSFTDDALLATPLTVGPSDATHDGCVRDERAYARWLAASGLPHRPAWPPELVSAVADPEGDTAVVTWRGDAGTAGLRYRVEGSSDGTRWSLLTDTGETFANIPATPYVRVAITDVRYGDSAPSDVYGATGAEWLVVDAFDRALDGSYDLPTHPFAATVGAALGAPFSVASNEAVATGEIDLTAYPRVLWLLGDEGLADRTFSPREMAAVQAFVEAGGTFVATGSEVAYATDPDWLDAVLHARFVADDAFTSEVEGWTVGAAYDEDYPDVLDGDEVLWRWSTGEPAAVGFDNRVAVIGFGLENLDAEDTAAAFASLLAWLD